MKNNILILCLLMSLSGLAGAATKFNLMEICQGKDASAPPSKSGPTMKMVKLDQQDIVITDNGFCAEFLKQQVELQVNETTLQLEEGINFPQNESCSNKQYQKAKNIQYNNKWKIRLYASHSFTTYFDTDVTFKSTRYNVEIKDYSWAERGSREFFNPKTLSKPGNNPFQWIDEPTNTFTVSIENNGHELFLSAFHPKFLQRPDQEKHIKGEIDGVAVDGVAPVNKIFDGYDQEPGESELVGNTNGHKQMSFEIGYGYRLKFLDTKIGSISYIPSIGLGVMTGQNYTVMVKANEWWEYEEYKDTYRIQGFGGSLTNRLELNTNRERIGVFYENKLGYYKQDHGFMDGSQKYDLKFMANTVGLKFMIYNPNNK